MLVAPDGKLRRDPLQLKVQLGKTLHGITGRFVPDLNAWSCADMAMFAQTGL